MIESDATTLIRGGTVVLGSSVEEADLLIRGERIAAVGELDDATADREVDASGLLVLPGAIDTHVHFNDEFMNTVSVHDYLTGTRAAAFGGVTAVVDFSNQRPGETLARTLQDKKDEARGRAVVDWGVHPVITEPTEETLAEIPDLVMAGAPTIKCYMTYRDEGLLTEIADLTRIQERLRDAGGMLMVHAEDDELAVEGIRSVVEAGDTSAHYHAVSKPTEVEDAAIRDCVEMVEEVGGALFVVHLASARGIEIVSEARARGLDVRAETCTHYLIFTDEILKRDDGIKWICSPPLRSAGVRDALWRGLADGRIHQVTSDDAAFSWEAKQYGADDFRECPNGLPGIEPRLEILHSEGVAKGRISLPRLVELVATNPARIFGFAPAKGTLAPGSDADVVLFDPEERWTMGVDTHHMSTDWSAYEGIEVTGRVKKVFSRGELIVDGGELLAEPGRGRYVFRALDPDLRRVSA